MSWGNLNNADRQTDFGLIPKGTLANVRLMIRPGGHDDVSRGWTGGYTTLSEKTGAVYLDCEFVVVGGQYDKRKIWSNIGLHSEKGDNWSNMGRAFMRGILESARGIQPKDESVEAQQARCIHGFADLDGIEFVALIDSDKDSSYGEKNIIRFAITPDHKRYQEFRGNVQPVNAQQQPQYTPSQPAQQPQANQQQTIKPTGKPSWAQ